LARRITASVIADDEGSVTAGDMAALTVAAAEEAHSVAFSTMVSSQEVPVTAPLSRSEIHHLSLRILVDVDVVAM
jgi:hypothetical protein